MSSEPRTGIAPIKKEFLAPRPVPIAPKPVPVASTEGAAASSEPAVEKEKREPSDGAHDGSRKRQRGQNKQRKHFRPDEPEQGMKLCAKFAANGQCEFGNGCRFSHDLAEYFKQRPADLGELCPIWTLRGECRFGVMCRFGRCHVEESTGVNLRQTVATPPYVEMNVVSWDLTQRLRRRDIDFTASDKISEAITADVARQHNEQHGWQHTIAEEPTSAVPAVDDSAAAEAAPPAASKHHLENPLAEYVSAPVEVAPSGEAGAASASGPDPAAAEAAYKERLADHFYDVSRPRRKRVDFGGKLYLAPLTTVGNLPFRRVCKDFGVDITCGEMALATSLLQGNASEWALLKRHPCEDMYGVQLAGNQAQTMGRVAQLINEHCVVDFVDINMGCPIDTICNKGMGASLACRPGRVQQVVRSMSSILTCPLTVKMRVGYDNDAPTAHKLIPKLPGWGAAAVTLHGRSRQQRYTKSADWSYIGRCASIASGLSKQAAVAEWSEQAAAAAAPSATTALQVEGGGGGGEGGGKGMPSGPSFFPLVGNGDVFSFEDAVSGMGEEGAGASAVMVARGALIKPWLFTEIKERRHWDISASERLDMLKTFTKYGLEHWGTDDRGVANVRKFLLEFLSFLYRYVPVGLLERLPARIQVISSALPCSPVTIFCARPCSPVLPPHLKSHLPRSQPQDRPPAFCGRSDLETLMASSNSADWVKLTELCLGKVPANFTFTPKHKSNAYEGEAQG